MAGRFSLVKLPARFQGEKRSILKDFKEKQLLNRSNHKIYGKFAEKAKKILTFGLFPSIFLMLRLHLKKFIFYGAIPLPQSSAARRMRADCEKSFAGRNG